MSKLAKVSFKCLNLFVVLLMVLSSPLEAAAHVWTEPTDYPPGSTVTIQGDNSDGAAYKVDEAVHVDVVGPNGYSETCDATVSAPDPNNQAYLHWSCDVLLWDSLLAEGGYTYTATSTSGVVETGTFTDAAGSINKVYQHWSDANSVWQNDILSEQKADYFEGEVVPHVFVYKASNNTPLTNGESYSINVTYDYYQDNTSAGGFAFMTTYNLSRQPGPLNATNPYIPPTQDNSFANAGGTQGDFYTVDADITNVSAVSYNGSGSLVGSVTITFKYTGTTTTNGIAEIYFGLAIAKPGQVPDQGSGTTRGANAWTGGSLQTAVDIGGSGATSLQLAPAGIIAGTISGFKWNDANGNGTFDAGESTIAGWTINLCPDVACATPLQTTTTDSSGNYTFSVLPGTYYVREQLQSGWRQTYPTSVVYGPSVVTASTSTYTGQNFGNQQVGTIVVEKVTTNADGTFGFTTTGGDGFPATFSITTTGKAGSTTYNNIVPGTYGVAEDMLAGWDLISSSCTSGTASSFTLAAGGTVTCTFTNTKQVFTLSLTKTDDLNPAKFDQVGQVVAYTLTATNTGNKILHAVNVSDDPSLDGLACTPTNGSDLAAGAQMICTGTHTITQADLDAGSFVDTASATSTETDAPDATDTIYGTKSASISLTKSAAPATYSAVDETITYSYLITNTGNVTLAGPFTVSDDKATVTCDAAPASGLAPLAAFSCTATYTIIQADLDAGEVTNKATATNGTVTSNEATATVTAEKKPALELTKSAIPTNYDAVGQTIAYSYLITNTGNVTLVGPFTVSDDKATVTCTQPADGSLSPTETTSCTASYTITQADLDGGKVTNTATATNGTVSSPPAQATVSAIRKGELGLTKSAAPETYSAVNETITYTYVVKNTGNITLAGPFTVNDNIVGAVSCPPGSLAPNATVTCTTTYLIEQADLDTGSVTNTATATDGTLTSNEATATVTADQKPSLTSTKVGVLDMTVVAPADRADVGDKINYTITVVNDGNVTLTGVTITDGKLGALNCTPDQPATLAPAATLTCTGSYTLTQVDIDAGKVDNIAIADSDQTSPTDIPEEVLVPPAPHLTTTKSGVLDMTVVAPTDRADVGDVINYTLTGTNVGNVTLTNVTISDPLLGTLTCTPIQPATLVPGASLVCMGNYTLTLADLNAGNVHNVAVGSSDKTPPTDTPNDVPVPPAPALALDKAGLLDMTVVAPINRADPGDKINYTLTATNRGNITLTNVSISDPLLVTLTCTPAQPATLNPGQSLVCTGGYTLTQADIDAGKVNNIGIADSDQTPPTETPNEVPVPQAPHLTTTKLGVLNMTVVDPMDRADVGDVINYTITALNDGNQTLTNVSINDPLLPSLTCTPAQPATLVPGASLVCMGGYTLTQVDIDAGKVGNMAITKSDQTPPTETPNEVPVPQSPAISLDKSASPTTYDAVGQIISYSYVITNTGNVTLVGPFTVSDDKTTVTCDAAPASGLAPLAKLSCTASYAITQADLDAGSVTNTATASTNYGGQPVISLPASATVTATQSPALTLDKTSVTATFAKVGDVIEYGYTLTNSGNVTLSGPFTVTDNKVTVNCPFAASLAPNGSITCNATYPVTQADIDAGSVTNTATGHASFGGQPVDSNPDSLTVDATQTPDVTLVKTATPNFHAPVQVGDTISYELVATNDGNVTLNNVLISDPILPSLTCTPAQPAILAPASTLTCSGSYILTQVDIDAGHVANTAVAISKLPGGGEGPGGKDSKDVPVPQNPALTIDKSAVEATYDLAGDVIHYSYLVTNSGNVTLHDAIVVTDDKAADESCPALPAEGLAPGGTLTCTASYVVTQADLDAGNVTNVASAASGITQSNMDTVTVNATQTPALALAKSASPSTYNAVGETISYSYVLTNSGNVTLSGPFTVTDDKAAVSCPTDAYLAVGASITCNASYTITQGDLDNGSVTNSAYGIGNFGGKEVKSNTDTETVTADQKPAITLTKTASPLTYDGVGQTITYSYVITNIGNVTLVGPFTVSDDKATVACDAAPANGLAPLGTLSCTAAYIITQVDLDAGSVKNTATASTTYHNNEVKSAPADATVTAVQKPAILLTKSVTSQGPYDSVGDVIDYKLVATNTGNVTLTNVTITDPKLGTLSCDKASPVSLAPGDKLTCSGSYTVKQSDLDAGKVDNTATAKGTFGGKDYTATASQSVSMTQNPAIMLTKTASPTTYAAAGQVIGYSLVAENTGNVTLNNVSISDPKLGTLTCTPAQPAILAPGEKLTCTGKYTIQAGDVKVDNSGTVENTATVTTKKPNGDTGPTTTATATVTQVAATGQILPTGTTCQQYRDGTALTMQQFYPPNGYVFYSLKGKVINSINPGVFFYYNKVSLPGGSFTIEITQLNTAAWPKIPVQVGTNIQLFDMSCSNLTKNVTMNYDPKTGITSIQGSLPAGDYIFSAKFAIGTEKYNKTTNNGLIGYTPAGNPKVTYTFTTKLNGVDILTSWAAQVLAPKK